MRTSGKAVALAVAILSTGLLASGAGASSDALPDLRVTTLNVQSQEPIVLTVVQPPAPVTIVIANAGFLEARDVVVEFAEIQPNGYRKVLSGHFAARIAPGSSVEFRATWSAPFDKVGDVDLVATVDPSNAVLESNELNNARHARATARMQTNGLVFPARSPLAPLDGPVFIGGEWAAYSFDIHDRHNPAPGLLLDRAGRGNDARMPKDPLAANGIIGLGARFDGKSVYEVDWRPGTNPLPQGGASFWINLDERPRFGQWAWSAPAGECHRQGVEIRPEGTVRLWAPSSLGGCVNSLESSKRIGPGDWVHVVVSWAGGTATLYVNGEPQGVMSSSSAPSPVYGPLFIGALNLNVPGQPPTGHLDKAVVDEFRLYDRALAPSDVAALYALGLRQPK